jgi:transcription antitermination protein NusB
MTRHEIREEIFKGLFQANFYKGKDIEKQFDTFFEESGPYPEEDAGYIKTKARAIVDNLDTIDKIINDTSDGWKTSRMPKVDLTIMRLAVYEIKIEELPRGVAINEAVELAKAYGEDSSPAFINGVLAKVV